MAKQVFVLNAASDLARYAAGASISAVAGQDEVSFAANGMVSVDLDKGELVNLSIMDYSAGTAQVATVDTTGVAAGVEIYVKVINTTIGTMNLPMKTFTGTAAAIAAAITAEKGDFEAFSATEAAGVVTVTAAVNSSFRLAAADGSVIAYTQNGVPSTGTAADVEALWEEGLPYAGVTNKVGFPVKRPNSPVVSGSTYDIAVASFVPVAASKDGMRAVKGESIKLIFAIDSTEATISNGGTAPLSDELATLA